MGRSSGEPRIIQGKTGDEFLADLRQREMHDVAEAWLIVMEFTHEVERRGGTVLVTGGSVRDELMGLEVKDFDLEVYHLPADEIKKIAQQYGKIEEDVGRAFPVIKLWFGRSQIDIGQPRREQKTGVGHRDYEVEADPNMRPAEAVRRRDFTMNALVKNPVTGEIMDYVGGLDDIAQKKLRVVDPARFIEDPLRVLRGVQFSGRFGLSVEAETKKLLADTAPHMDALTRDRVRLEWEKLFIKGQQPSVGLELARDIGLFKPFPELQSLKDTPQDTEYHPEGDVWTHTMMVVDGAARLAAKKQLAPNETLAVMLGALGHDVGKATTTVADGGHTRSYGHETAGIAPMERWMTEQGFTADTIQTVLPMIREHMNPTGLWHANQKQPLRDGPIRRLANRLHPATIRQLLVVCEADHFGRDLPTTEFPAGEWLLERAAGLNIDQKKPEPIIRGRDLEALGYPAGIIMGKIIRAAEKIAEEKSLTGPEIMEHLKKHADPTAALAELESLLT